MSNITPLNVPTKLDIPVDKVLAGAVEANMRCAIVLGRDESGAFFFASSIGDVAEINWLLDVAKHRLISELKISPGGP